MSSLTRIAAGGALVAMAIVAAPVIATATPLGTVSESASVPSTATNWTQALNFAGFNSFGLTGVTLDSVTFDLTETMVGTAQATNNGTSAAVGDFIFTNTAKLNAGTFGAVINQQNSSTITINSGDTSPTQNIGGSTANSTTLTTGLAQFLPAFTGTATDTGAEGLSFTGGNLAALFTDMGALTVQVTYAYSVAAPEPATIALLSVGLLGLGFVRYRRGA